MSELSKPEAKNNKRKSRRKEVKNTPEDHDLRVAETAAVTSTIVEPSPYGVNTDRLLLWLAKIKTGLARRINNQVLVNNLVRECFTIKGESPTLEQASKMVNEVMEKNKAMEKQKHSTQ